HLRAPADHAQVAGEGELRSAAVSGAVDGRHEDLVGELQGPEGAPEVEEEGPHLLLAHAGALLEVGAGAESLVARAGDHHRPKLALRLRLLDQALELGSHGAGNGVAPRLSVDGPDLDRAALARFHPELGHLSSPAIARPFPPLASAHRAARGSSGPEAPAPPG